MNGEYARLKSGEWGVRVFGRARPGDRVTVYRRDGTSRDETVFKVVISGKLLSLCSVSKGGEKQTRVCAGCGYSFTDEQARRRGGDWLRFDCGCGRVAAGAPVVPLAVKQDLRLKRAFDAALSMPVGPPYTPKVFRAYVPDPLLEHPPW